MDRPITASSLRAGITATTDFGRVSNFSTGAARTRQNPARPNSIYNHTTSDAAPASSKRITDT